MEFVVATLIMGSKTDFEYQLGGRGWTILCCCITSSLGVSLIFSHIYCFIFQGYWLNFFFSLKQGCQFFVLALFLFLCQWTLSSFVLIFLLQFLLVYFSKYMWVFSSIFLEAIARLQSGYMFYDICEVTLSFFILDKCENSSLSPSH